VAIRHGARKFTPQNAYGRRYRDGHSDYPRRTTGAHRSRRGPTRRLTSCHGAVGWIPRTTRATVAYCLEADETVPDGQRLRVRWRPARFHLKDSTSCEWCNERWFGWDSELSYYTGCEHWDVTGWTTADRGDSQRSESRTPHNDQRANLSWSSQIESRVPERLHSRASPG
jgi:hypothetical protein